MNEELFIEKVLKLEEDVAVIKDTMATKDDIRMLLDGQDKIMKILLTHDEERLMTNVRLDRHETRIEALEAQAT